MNTKQLKRIELALLLLIFVLLMSTQTQRASALFPSIVSITPWTENTHTVLNITVNHTPPPSLGPSHYVSTVEIEINGAIQDLNQTTPQSTETFIVQYDMGAISETPQVRARAYCIVHLWGGWSNTVTVPEYGLIPLAAFLVSCTLLTVFMRTSRIPDRRRVLSVSNPSQNPDHRNRLVYKNM